MDERPLSQREEVTVDTGCARCGGEHKNLVVKKLTNPVYLFDDYGRNFGVVNTHWAPCPVNGEPLLLRFAEDRHEEESP